MKNKFSISILFAVTLILGFTLSVTPEERIVENIVVEEWIVPIYAIDAKGNSVTDLNQNEIELYVNDKKVSDFNFIKRKFLNENKEKPKWFKTGEEEKVIVLVFDSALSKSPSIMKSKAIAEELINRSGPDTKFVLFKIEGFQGLSYLGGPTNDKQRINTIIKKRVVGRDNERSVTSGVDDSEGEKTKYQHDERMFFLIQQTRYLSNKSSQFASSFQSLYYAISNIAGTKFVYLFSEGISHSSWSRGDTHASKMAGNLLRSGAVLFFINPAGGRGSNSESGEEFLQVLSSLSGGKYFTGDTKSINDKITNVHKAYYELTFRNPDDMKGGHLRIDIRAKRKNVNIHTIRNLEKSRGYFILNDFEKKLVVLNMISKNPMFKQPVAVDDAKILKEEKKGSKTVYEISVPEHFRNTDLDLYKIHMPITGNKPIIKKTLIKVSKNIFKIEIMNKEGFSPHFALINYNMGLAIIKGIEKKAIKISAAAFSNGTLEFELSDFKLKKVKEKEVSLLRITIKIIDPVGNEIKSDTKEISTIKERTKLRVPLRLTRKSDYNILIQVKDMISDDETNEVIEVKLK